MSKMINVYELFQAYENIFKCPICHTSLTCQNGKSLVCTKGHCFDLSKYGYISFLPNQQLTKYTKEKFISRREVFELGYYEPLKEYLQNIISKHFNTEEEIFILDAGCGEGYYAQSIYENCSKASLFALDNSKDAIVLGARKSSNIKWIVGDLTNIPLGNKTMDVILDIFTPSNYTEFQRVLKNEGYLIKVIPGEKYLEELRNCAKNQIKNESYSNLQVVKYFEEHIKIVDKYHLTYKEAVDSQQLDAFLRMSPMMFHVKKELLRLESVTELTFEFLILVGKF